MKKRFKKKNKLQNKKVVAIKRKYTKRKKISYHSLVYNTKSPRKTSKKNLKVVKRKYTKKKLVIVSENKPKRKYTKKPKLDLVSIPVESSVTSSLIPTSSVLPVVVKEKKQTQSEKNYFTVDTEKKIVEYNLEENSDKREILYNNFIKKPFEKLVENIFNTFKFSYFETSPLDVQKETISHLVYNISKYEPVKGKAFSYFSIVAKHYLIFMNNHNYKRFNQSVEIAEGREENTVQLQTVDAFHKKKEMSEFMALMIKFWETNLHKIFFKQRDLDIANAVIELFRNCSRIDAYNKKALYLYIREISNCKTQQITKVINKMKSYQSVISKSYIENGIVNTNKCTNI